MLGEEAKAALRPEEKVPLRRRNVQQFEAAVLGLVRAAPGSVHGAGIRRRYVISRAKRAD